VPDERTSEAATSNSLRLPVRALLQGLQEWRASYREALTRWRALERTVRFPWGAYWFPTFHGAETTDPSRAPPFAA
jgi:hypothetical protein